jgi:hypothetical protein
MTRLRSKGTKVVHNHWVSLLLLEVKAPWTMGSFRSPNTGYIMAIPLSDHATCSRRRSLGRIALLLDIPASMYPFFLVAIVSVSFRVIATGADNKDRTIHYLARCAVQ